MQHARFCRSATRGVASRGYYTKTPWSNGRGASWTNSPNLLRSMAPRSAGSSAAAAKTQLDAAVMDQYDTDQTQIFYRTVMGGGGEDIHYGVFKDPATDGVFEASENTVKLLMDCLEWHAQEPIGARHVGLDLGSGHGGATHRIVQRFGCAMQDMNLCANQNASNEEKCAALGIGDKVSVLTASFDGGLPFATASFDFVWSEEVFCHAADKKSLLREVQRVLKPGGSLIFTDIMGRDDATQDALDSFTDRNATAIMARPKDYGRWLGEAGLECEWQLDLSRHLLPYFEKMLFQIADNKDELKAEGCEEAYLDTWSESLSQRIETQRDARTFAWAAFCARKPLAPYA